VPGQDDSVFHWGIQLIAGTGCPRLANDISDYLAIPLSGRDIIQFPNENLFVRLHGSARGQDVYIIQTTSPPVHRNLMELLILIDCLKRDSASRVTDQPRVPITARLVTDMIEVAGADRWITIDLHAGQIQGFFKIPGDELTAFHILSDYFAAKRLENVVILTGDLGFAKRGRNFAEKRGADHHWRCQGEECHCRGRRGRHWQFDGAGGDDRSGAGGKQHLSQFRPCTLVRISG